MAQITQNQVKSDFEEIVGWPYVSPGTNDERGIDCSGAWVRCYKKYGLTIAHGSNTIYRKECSSVGTINSESDLKVGMMVFKNGFDNGEPDKYKGDGIGNMRHIGAVTQINPLVITHATSPIAKQDFGYAKCMKNGWTHWGVGKRVNILGSSSVEEGVVSMPEEDVKFIIFDDGGVRLRESPNKTGKYMCTIPKGEIVTKISSKGNAPYFETRYDAKGLVGYIDYTFANPVAPNEDLDSSDELPDTEHDSGEYVYLKVKREIAEELLSQLKNIELSDG